MRANKPTKDAYLRVPADVHHRAKVRAAEEGRSLKEIVARLLERWLEGKTV